MRKKNIHTTQEKAIWHNMSADAVLRELKSRKDGLDDKEAAKRLKKYGENKLPREKGKTRLKIFFSQFLSPLIYVLLIAAVFSLALKDFTDAAVIMSAVVMNTIIGYFQERKADQALESIRKMIKQSAKVLRRSKSGPRELEIQSENLVLGDIILLSSGDRVPADARLIEVNELQINEAGLTGESLPINKLILRLDKGANLADRENMAYMGTVVMNGNAKAVICEIGIQTELGQIAAMVKETIEEKTPLQNQISKFSKSLSIIIISLCFFILIAGLLRGVKFFEIFFMAVAIAVASIPEGLVVSVTIILAIGMRAILKKNALVKKLVAAETLGSASIICTDKTGTLTEGKMMVSHIIVDSNKNEKELAQKRNFKDLILKSPNIGLALEIGMLCNNVFLENPNDELHKWILRGDPTEKALYMAAVQSGYNKNDLEKKFLKVHEIPFNEERKYMATIHREGDGLAIYYKGAPEILIEMANRIDRNGQLFNIDNESRKELKAQYENLTKKGLRVLAVGYKRIKDSDSSIDLNIESSLEKLNIAEDMIFVGLLGLQDPLRKDARETIISCLNAGIRPILITGDHKLTAHAIMQEVGVNAKLDNVLEGSDLDKMSDEQLKKIVKNIDIYARVSPRHKLRIIDAWQAKGEVVAMAGDGVNDAPALKSADIGIALGSGTDVAKETADIILLDDAFKTIVDIIQHGRVIFDNIRKVVLYLLSDSFSEMILITACLLFNIPLPLLPAQILWINLITDGFPGIAMTMEPAEIEVEKEKPRAKYEPLLNFEIKSLILIISCVTALIIFLAYLYLLRIGLDLKYLRSLSFALLGTDSLIYVFSCKSLRKPIWRTNLFKNKYLIAAIIGGFILQLLPLYVKPLQILLKTVPLSIRDWMIIIIFGIINILIIEAVKKIFNGVNQ